jgi:hypothetical protein
MMKNTNRLIPSLILTSSLMSYLISPSSWATDQIIRPYQSVRSAGMGGVRITTGLYDENFFNNPARVTANPDSKLTLLQITPVEVGSNTLQVANQLAKGGNDVSATLSELTGSNLHYRAQVILPAYYLAANEDRKWALAFAMIGSIQADWLLSEAYQMNLGAIADVGPAITYGRKFLDDRLSVGVTGHYLFRAGANPSYGLVDYIQGTPLKLNTLAGQGSMINFDLGTTYRLTELAGFQVSLGAAVQNILGGTFSKNSPNLLNVNGVAPSQPTSFGLGASFYRESLAFLSDTVFAIEGTDYLNNRNGSLFRTIHLGGETHWKFLAVRAGLNQGYLSAGLGINLHFITLDFATYGEEIGLNAGTREDRRYTANIGFHI